MTVSKETATKVEQLLQLEKEANNIREELLAEFGEYFDGCYIEGFFVSDWSVGEDQGEGEYCDQWTGYSEDSGSGVYYYPIEGSNKYLAVNYCF